MIATFNPTIFDSVFPESYPLLFVTISGAHLYGFPSPDSDYDLRGVHILPIEEVVGLDRGRETIEVSTEHKGMEIDLVTHDAHKFFLLLMKKNGYVLEQLYSPLIVKGSPEHEELKSIARKCITRHHVYHYRHFAETQWELLEQQQPPTAKALLYVYRVLLTGIHLMQTGEVEANLVHLNDKFHLPYIEELITLKASSTEKGGIAEKDLAFHRQEFETLQSRLSMAAEKTFLPDKPGSRLELHNLLVRLRKK